MENEVNVGNSGSEENLDDRDVYQQGDVLLYPNAKIPNGVVEIEPKNGQLVLASGSHTGHAHVINLSDSPDTKFLKAEDGKRFLSVKNPDPTLYHEEHDNFKLPVGDYLVGTVQEEDPFTEEIRDVQD